MQASRIPSIEEQAALTLQQLLALLSSHAIGEVELVSRPSSKIRRLRVTYDKHSVFLQERSGSASIQLEDGRNAADRRSTGTRCWVAALQQADQLLRAHVLSELDGKVRFDEVERTGGDPPLQTVVDYYIEQRIKLPSQGQTPAGVKPISYHHARKILFIVDIISHLFGLRRTVSFYNESFVKEYLHRRTTQGVRFPQQYKRQECRPVLMKTAVAELKDFSSLVQFAADQKIIPSNPLQGYQWQAWLDGDQHAVVHMEEAHPRRIGLLIARPKLTDPTTGERLDAPIHRITCVDRGARARIVHLLGYHTGHRLVSIRSILCGDVALTAEEVRALLRRAPNHREWWAEHYPYGAVLWRSSKQGYVRVTPISEALHKELLRWKQLHPAWETDNPLVPSVLNASVPVSETSLREWTNKAYEIVRQDLKRLGTPPTDVARLLGGAMFHGYRSLWSTTLDRLGWGWQVATDGDGSLNMHNHVQFMGDWQLDGGVRLRVYTRLEPGILQAIAEFESADTVYRKFSARTATDVRDVLAAISEADEEA